eukprot:TRINITY_DN3454_c0_g1_i1.p1 TRINITY_DN3454_c0_g1~~TRINITY_DN3454_c0_g1_i1.p1  ORF type:complete len:475 (+),score=82.84 TRINITY_DN3454_c0_g1_i1:64-1488(+)
MSASILNSAELLRRLEQSKVVLDAFDAEVIGRVSHGLSDGNMKFEMLSDWAAALHMLSYKYRREFEVGVNVRRVSLMQNTVMDDKQITVEIFVKAWVDNKCSHLTTVSAHIARSTVQVHQKCRDSLELKSLRGSNLSPGHTVVQIRAAMHGQWVAICDSRDLSAFILHSQLYGYLLQLTADVVPSASLPDPCPLLQCGDGLLRAGSVLNRRHLLSHYKKDPVINTSDLCDGGIICCESTHQLKRPKTDQLMITTTRISPDLGSVFRAIQSADDHFHKLLLKGVQSFCDAGPPAGLDYVFDPQLDLNQDEEDGDIIESNYNDTELNSDDDDVDQLELTINIPHDPGPFVTPIAPDGSGRFTIRVPPDGVPGGEFTHSVAVPVNRVCRTFAPRPADFTATEGSCNWGVLSATYSEVPNKIKRSPSAPDKAKSQPVPWKLEGVSLRLRQGAPKRQPDIFEYELASGTFLYPSKTVPS